MDKQFLYDLMAEFKKCDIQELSFKNEQGSIHLRKAAHVAKQELLIPPLAPVTESTSPSAATSSTVEIITDGEVIKAPIVGNFYRQPAPDAPYFVNEGDRVNKGQTLCILEAMKLMNELEAEFDCVIVKVLVGNGSMVQFDTPLFEVKRV